MGTSIILYFGYAVNPGKVALLGRGFKPKFSGRKTNQLMRRKIQQQIEQIAQETFGYNRLRPGQEEVI